MTVCQGSGSYNEIVDDLVGDEGGLLINLAAVEDPMAHGGDLGRFLERYRKRKHDPAQRDGI